MNWKLICKIIGVLLLIQAGLLAACMGVGLYYGEGEMPFVWTALLAAALGTGLTVGGRGSGTNMSRKDGYIVVSLTWFIYSLTGMLPFLLSGTVGDPASAFFETMSGFTTTGATIIDNCDALPRSILAWRSLAQWIGGIGIIFFTIAILPAFGVGEVKLFAAESTGIFHDKVHPRISVTARWIGGVYFGITCLCGGAYYLCGMSVFDAVNYALTTTATGGYGTHSALLQDVYQSPTIEYVMSGFMVLSGINYTLIYFSLLKGHVRRLFDDAECRCFFLIFMTITAACTLINTAHSAAWQSVDWRSMDWGGMAGALETAFRQSLFTVVALQTTTGYAVCDYTCWPVAVMPLLLFVMFAGACSGSSSSGFKCVRWSIIYRVVKNEVKHILHPRAVLPVRMNKGVIPTQIIHTTFAFAALFAAAVFGGAFVLTLTGLQAGAPCRLDYYDAISIALSSTANIGPAMGYFGPMHSWAVLAPASKLVCSLLMLVGRLEIFPILLLFTHSFWKKS